MMRVWCKIKGIGLALFDAIRQYQEQRNKHRGPYL
jgi:hypothetical protein